MAGAVERFLTRFKTNVSLPTFVTLMHLTSGVGVLKAEYGGGGLTFQAGLDIISDGRAATEGNATVQPLSIKAGEHSRKLELSKAVSKTTDSAPTATAMFSSQFVAEAKQISSSRWNDRR